MHLIRLITNLKRGEVSIIYQHGHKGTFVTQQHLSKLT